MVSVKIAVVCIGSMFKIVYLIWLMLVAATGIVIVVPDALSVFTEATSAELKPLPVL